MAEVVSYSNEFLPHVIKLFSPEVQKADARLNYFRQLFALHQPDPNQSCLLVKGRDRLLACAHIVSLDKLQPGLVYINFAADKGGLTPQDWDSLWKRCSELASEIVDGPPTIRTAISGDSIPAFLQSVGFTVAREQLELHAQFGQLPPVQDTGFGDFQVRTLAEQPGLEQQWRDSFNSGLTTLWDIPPIDSETFQRLRNTQGFDPSAFRLGFDAGEPVAALFYSVVDSHLGIVRINAAATPSAKRSKGYGRRMLKDAINHLEQQGYTSAIIFTDSVNQATNLLFKMLGFSPFRAIKILETEIVKSVKAESPQALIQDQVAVADDTKDGEDDKPKKQDFGFFPGGFYDKKR